MPEGITLQGFIGARKVCEDSIVGLGDQQAGLNLIQIEGVCKPGEERKSTQATEYSIPPMPLSDFTLEEKIAKPK